MHTPHKQLSLLPHEYEPGTQCVRKCVSPPDDSPDVLSQLKTTSAEAISAASRPRSDPFLTATFIALVDQALPHVYHGARVYLGKLMSLIEIGHPLAQIA